MFVVLVDTSLWIDGKHGSALEALHAKEPLAMCPAVVQEILQGANTAALYEAYTKRIERFTIIDSPTPLARFEHAARLYVACKKIGYTVTGYDCLIAATALANNVLLLHADADFEFIAEAVPTLQQHRL